MLNSIVVKNSNGHQSFSKNDYTLTCTNQYVLDWVNFYRGTCVEINGMNDIEHKFNT